MIAKCSIYDLGEFLAEIMEEDKEVFFSISEENGGQIVTISYDDIMNVVNEIYLQSSVLREVVYIIDEDDEYDEAIEEIYGTKGYATEEKYDEVFGRIVKKIKVASEINDYTIGRGGSDFLVVSNSEYGDEKYTIHKREISYDKNGEGCLY